MFAVRHVRSQHDINCRARIGRHIVDVIAPTGSFHRCEMLVEFVQICLFDSTRMAQRHVRAFKALELHHTFKRQIEFVGVNNVDDNNFVTSVTQALKALQ